MARVTRVAKAQQRYATKPVIDPETGQQKVTQVMKRTRVFNEATEEYEVKEIPKTDKRGKPVTMRVTVVDKTKPKPNLRCDFPGCDIDDREIKPGTPYAWIKPKSGPYGGTLKARHAQHPTWQIWEYSSSLSARVAQVQSEGAEEIANLAEVDDFESVKDSLTQMAQDLLDEKQESLDNMPEGLAEGSQLAEQVEALESWVETIGDVDEPDAPEAENQVLWYVGGPEAQSLNEEGYETEDEAQNALDAFLAENPEENADDWSVDSEETGEEGEVSEEDMETWLDEAREVLQAALDDFQG